MEISKISGQNFGAIITVEKGRIIHDLGETIGHATLRRALRRLHNLYPNSNMHVSLDDFYKSNYKYDSFLLASVTKSNDPKEIPEYVVVPFKKLPTGLFSDYRKQRVMQENSQNLVEEIISACARKFGASE